jgi:hypothetical protein
MSWQRTSLLSNEGPVLRKLHHLHKTAEESHC